MRSALAFTALLLIPLAAAPAQNDTDHAAHHPMGPAEREVLAVIQRVFDGMRARDTVMMRSGFAPEARLVTTGVQDGVPRVRTVEIDRWMASVSSATEVVDERLVHPEVRVDDNLASVWVGYNLYIGTRFSHCGYDAFQLARTADGWKIIHVMDTRRRENCPTEASGR